MMSVTFFAFSPSLPSLVRPPRLGGDYFPVPSGDRVDEPLKRASPIFQALKVNLAELTAHPGTGGIYSFEAAASVVKAKKGTLIFLRPAEMMSVPFLADAPLFRDESGH